MLLCIHPSICKTLSYLSLSKPESRSHRAAGLRKRQSKKKKAGGKVIEIEAEIEAWQCVIKCMYICLHLSIYVVCLCE